MPSSVEKHLCAMIRRRGIVCTACGKGDRGGRVVMHLPSTSQWVVRGEEAWEDKLFLWLLSSVRTYWKPVFMADIMLSEEIRKNQDGPYPQGAHSLLSCLSDSPTRLWAPGGQALVFIWKGMCHWEFSLNLQSLLCCFYWNCSSHVISFGECNVEILNEKSKRRVDKVFCLLLLVLSDLLLPGSSLGALGLGGVTTEISLTPSFGWQQIHSLLGQLICSKR